MEAGRECPICAEPLRRHIFCGRHWNMLHWGARKMLWFLWAEGHPRPGFEEAVENFAEQVRESIVDGRR